MPSHIQLTFSPGLSTSDPAIKRRRIADASPAVCADELPPSPRRSCRSTPLDLAQRENALVKRERDLQCKSDDLDHRLSRLADREELARLLISQAALREAKSTLLQLEDHFTCPL
jgi:hypothetical protein